MSPVRACFALAFGMFAALAFVALAALGVVSGCDYARAGMSAHVAIAVMHTAACVYGCTLAARIMDAAEAALVGTLDRDQVELNSNGKPEE